LFAEGVLALCDVMRMRLLGELDKAIANGLA
jgi:hypothetical protein